MRDEANRVKPIKGNETVHTAAQIAWGRDNDNRSPKGNMWSAIPVALL